MTDEFKAAMVFAHPGHELTVLGLIQRHRPSILYLTRADSAGETQREQAAKDVLTHFGLERQTTFLSVSEPVSYRAALEGKWFDYHRLRGQIAQWLKQTRPDVVFGDAFERYNFHHDLCRLLLDSALADYRAERGRDVPSWELPLACYSSVDLARLTCRELELEQNGFEFYALTDQELAAKTRIVSAIADRSRYVRGVVSAFPEDRFRCEPFRQARALSDLKQTREGYVGMDYDAWGRQRVEAGKYAQPILFDKHFRPLIEEFAAASFGADPSQAQSKAA